MFDTEWFCGRGVDDEGSRTACAGARRIAATIFICGVGLALLGLIGGCAAAAPAADVPVYVLDDQEGGLVANLYATPCKDPRIVEFFQVGKPEFVERLHEARTKFRMMSGQWRDYAGCWIELTKEEVGKEIIFLLTEDGDRYFLPKDAFRAPGAEV